MKKEEIIKKLEEELEAGDYIVDLHYNETILNIVKIVKFHGDKKELIKSG